MSQIYTELKELDPAVTPADLDTRSDADAQALLHRIGATDPGASTRTLVPRRRRRIARALLTGTVAVVAVGAFAISDDGDVGSDDSVAWAAVPVGVSDAQANLAADACRRHTGEDSLKTIAVERRGARILAMLSGPDEERLCVLEGSGTDLKVIGASGSSNGSSSDESNPGRSIKPDELIGSFDGEFTDGEKTLIHASGRVGSDVKKVVLDTKDQGKVTATVDNGHFVAWWPSEDPADRDGGPIGSEGPEAARLQPVGQSPQTATGATVTLADGIERELSGKQLSGSKTLLLCGPGQAKPVDAKSAKPSDGLPAKVRCPSAKP